MLVYCLMLELADQATEKQQLKILQDSLSSRQLTSFSAIRNRASWVSRDLYLSLLDLCIPSLKQLSPTQYRTFMSILGQMIVADKSISVFEWCIFKILRYSLAEAAPTEKSVDISHCGWACEGLLSVLAGIGHDDSAQAELAFSRASAELSLSAPLSFRPAPEQQTEVLEKATDLLKNLKPLQKPRLLKAMAVCIAADGEITTQEAELLRAVGALLDCPIPPMLEQQQFI